MPLFSQMESKLTLQLFEDVELNDTSLDSCFKTLRRKVVSVRVFAASGSFQRITRSRRVTPSGLVSAIGGILSLFTGMSILSLSEATFWLARIFGAAFR